MKKDNLWFGSGLIVCGALLLLDNLNIIRIGDALSTYWPVVLVVIGIRMVSKKS
jgi:hypothetical protein